MAGRTRFQEILLVSTCIFGASARSAAQTKQATIELYLSNSTLDDYPDRISTNTAVRVRRFSRSPSRDLAARNAIDK